MKNKNIGLYIAFIGIFLLLAINLFVSLYIPFSNSTENIFNENILKVVEIKVSDDEETWGYATGCFVDNNGTILTNKHVVLNSSTNENYQIIKARMANEEEWISCDVIKVGNDDDIALIKIDRKNTKYFKIKTNCQNGETIFTIGNPNNFGLSFSSGVISSNKKYITYEEKQTQVVQTSLVINEGNSGGPVFDKNGELVGLISFRLKDKYGDVIQGVSFAVPSSIIKEFIK